MIENNNRVSKKKDNDYWQEGYKVFLGISGWIAGPIIAALFLGSWLDEKYQTNRYLYICIAVAFIISNVGLIKEVMNYSKKLKKIDKIKKENSNDRTNRNSISTRD